MPKRVKAKVVINALKCTAEYDVEVPSKAFIDILRHLLIEVKMPDRNASLADVIDIELQEKA